MSEITIEAFGGFVGAGAPGSHLHMRGKVAWSTLSEVDRAAIDRLFAERKPVAGNLYYRLTRDGSAGVETIEVLPDQVPQTLINSVRTVLD